MAGRRRLEKTGVEGGGEAGEGSNAIGAGWLRVPRRDAGGGLAADGTGAGGERNEVKSDDVSLSNEKQSSREARARAQAKTAPASQAPPVISQRLAACRIERGCARPHGQ
eukprot:3348566-Pleurochrysis_carterae.AAC.4